MSNEHEIIKKVVQFYFERKVPIHVVLKDKSWENGFVKEISNDFFTLEEFESGLLPVFFHTIITVTPYTLPFKKDIMLP